MHNVKRTQLGCLLCSSFANWTNRVFVPVRVFLQNIFQDLCRTLWGFLERDSEWNDIRLWSVFCTNYFICLQQPDCHYLLWHFIKRNCLAVCIYIKKLAKIILWSNSDIFGTKLQVWIWTSNSLPGMRLGCSSTCSTSICWNEIRFGLTAELFYWSLKIDRNLDKKNADIKWVASELVEVVCYTSVSLKGIHGTRRNILSFSFVVLCFLVVQWNVICWIWKISIMIKFSDDHVFSFFPLFLLWMICQCGFSFYILCLFLCFNAMILLCFLEILMWNSLHYTHTETHAAFGVLVRALPCDSGCCCLQWPLLIIT